MPKLSLTVVVALVLAGAIGYLAFDPDAARDLSAWVKRQVNGRDVPDAKSLGYHSYRPVTPMR